MDRVRLSKRMSRAVRHDPARVGLVLDAAGWTPVDALCRALGVSAGEVEDVVANGSKQRYELADGHIRARYGHSLPGHVDMPPAAPPPVLFHGTGESTVEAILREGLHAGGRQYVHLSPSEATACEVGTRHGRPVVLTVDARAAAADGAVFRRGNDDTWLTDDLDPRYLRRT
ncbi:RNA 2'-phosphotransferase [Actinomycetospora lutea]|uniref:RNA 2'-phosphotransferase n=1 Tax=Actinomycetospora lutea TaxID=663604 RepID=UPI0023673E7F|nr:RNA 2'-phosphotransferase [Actinomycetospora lutea]MDD7939316.1 RNA 2'-phosphotransferase [Actinomycetospora lutea]